MFRRIAILYLFISILCSCASYNKTTSVIIGSKYDEETNLTNCFIIPYGSVFLKGEWQKWKYVENSHQQFFINSDSIYISIKISPINKNFEFNQDGSKTGFNFVKAYYEWDTDYILSQIQNLNRETIETDTTNRILIYRLFKKDDIHDINNYFLAAEKNGNFILLTESDKDIWSRDYKIQFLKDIYSTYK